MGSKGSAAFKTADYLKSKSHEIGERINENLITDNSTKQEQIARLLSELLFAAFVIAEKEGVGIEEAFLQNVDEMILNSVQ